MGRLPRSIDDGLVDHALNRANNRGDVFADDADQLAFPQALAAAKERDPFQSRARWFRTTSTCWSCCGTSRRTHYEPGLWPTRPSIAGRASRTTGRGRTIPCCARSPSGRSWAGPRRSGECFFVRHAYFLGADDPYGKLRRALRAEIDEAQWSTLYSTKSYRFESPASGKLAIKAINHDSDEVLETYTVRDGNWNAANNDENPSISG